MNIPSELFRELNAQEHELVQKNLKPASVILSELDNKSLAPNDASVVPATYNGEYGSYPMTVGKVSKSHFTYTEQQDETVPTWALGGCY